MSGQLLASACLFPQLLVLLQLEMLGRLSGAMNLMFLDAVNVLLILAYFAYILRALYGALVCVGAVRALPGLFPECEFLSDVAETVSLSV